MLTEENTFARHDTFPSWLVNAIQQFLSTAAPAFSLTQQDATHIQVVAGAEDLAAVIAIKGKWRWIEATINRAHPGGAAGTWDIYVTAANNKIDSTPLPGTDNTNRAFALAIVEAGKTPTIVAGTVDIFRKIGTLAWSGTAITRVDQTVPLAPTHAHRHASGQPDAIAPLDIGAVAYVEDTLAKRPAAGQSNRLFKATDTGTLYHDTGTTWEVIGAGLAVRFGAGSLTAEPGDLVVANATGTITLPAVAVNARVGLWAPAATGAKLKAAGTAKIFGDFINAATEITLTQYQHVEVVCDGTNWLIVAGEPKREQAYVHATVLKAAAEAGVEASATRPAIVNLKALETPKPVTVGGVEVSEVQTTGAWSTVYLLPGQKWKTETGVTSATLLL